MTESSSSGFKFVIRGNYENTLRYLEKEKVQKPDVRFAFNTRENSVEQNCQTPDYFFNEVLNLNHTTSTMKRKQSLIQEAQHRYSKDSGFSDWNSLERSKENRVSLDRPIIDFQEKIDISDLVLEQNIIDLIDLGRFSHLTVRSESLEDPLSTALEETTKAAEIGAAQSGKKQGGNLASRSTGVSSQISSSTSCGCGPDHPDLDEVEYFDSNSLDIERISPGEATEHYYRKFKNKHLQDVIRSSVKDRLSTGSTMSDLFDDLDGVCEMMADKITEKMSIKAEASRCNPSSTCGSRNSCISHVTSRRKSEFHPRDAPSELATESCCCALHSHGLSRFSSVESSTQHSLKRKKIKKGKKLYRSSSAGDVLDEKIVRDFGKLDEVVASKQKKSRIGDFKRRVSMKPPEKKKSKKLLRSNSTGDILDPEDMVDDAVKLKPMLAKRKSCVPAIIGDFKRKVSLKSIKTEFIPPAPPPPPPLPAKIEYDEETSKNLQTPRYVHKQHAKVMAEINDAKEVAQMDIPAMFMYDIDLKNEVWVSQPGDNRIYQLEQSCHVCREGFTKSAFIVCSGGIFWHSKCFL